MEQVRDCSLTFEQKTYDMSFVGFAANGGGVYAMQFDMVGILSVSLFSPNDTYSCPSSLIAYGFGLEEQFHSRFKDRQQQVEWT